MAVNIAVEHRLATVDDSGLTSVALCVCGRSWIGIGADRVQDARYQHARHAYEASFALVDNPRKVPVEPVREDMSPLPTNPRGRPAGSTVTRTERLAQVGGLLAEGLVVAEIATRLELGVAYTWKIVREVRSANSQERLVA